MTERKRLAIAVAVPVAVLLWVVLPGVIWGFPGFISALVLLGVVAWMGIVGVMTYDALSIGKDQ